MFAFSTGVYMLDGATDYEHCVGDPLMATKRDALQFISENAPELEITHAIALVPLHRPRYSLWRGE